MNNGNKSSRVNILSLQEGVTNTVLIAHLNEYEDSLMKIITH